MASSVTAVEQDNDPLLRPADEEEIDISSDTEVAPSGTRGSSASPKDTASFSDSSFTDAGSANKYKYFQGIALFRNTKILEAEEFFRVKTPEQQSDIWFLTHHAEVRLLASRTSYSTIQIFISLVSNSCMCFLFVVLSISMVQMCVWRSVMVDGDISLYERACDEIEKVEKVLVDVYEKNKDDNAVVRSALIMLHLLLCTFPRPLALLLSRFFA